MTITILDLKPSHTDRIQQSATILRIAFAEHWSTAWATQAEALQEIREMLGDSERICRVALNDKKRVVGVIGGIATYEGHVWELHPLAVHPAYQGQGIGRALVLDLEAQVKARGGITIMLGSDDEDDMTSLAGVDIYPDLWQKITTIQNFKGHPFSFYQQLGYQIIGVIPDANGLGKPDILMGKRIQPWQK